MNATLWEPCVDEDDSPCQWVPGTIKFSIYLAHAWPLVTQREGASEDGVLTSIDG